MSNLPQIPLELVKAYEEEIRKSASRATSKRKMSSLRKFFAWAHSKGHIASNPLIQDVQPGQPSVVSPAEGQSEIVLGKPKSKISFWSVIRISGALGLVILLVFLVTKIKIPIPFKRAPAQESSQGVFPSPQSPSPPGGVVILSPWKIWSKLNLKDKNGHPINQPLQVVFKIYDTKENGNPVYTSDPKEVTPDQQGSVLIVIDNVPTEVFFQNNELYLSTQIEGSESTQRVPVSTANNAANSALLGYYPPKIDGATPQTIPVISADGALLLAAESPSIKATVGNLLVEGQAVTIATPTGSDGDIQINPDGSGNVSLIFEGTSGNQISATASNLIKGSLFYGVVANNSSGYDLIKLQSGSPSQTRFSVDALGNTFASGNLNVGGNLQTSNVDRLTSTGSLTNITGYSQSSGNFSINESSGDTASIIKKGSALSDVLSLTLDERKNKSSNYSTLTLKRYDGGSDAMALFVDEGNARFDGDVTINARLSATPGGTNDITFTTDADSTVVISGLAGGTGTALCVDGSNNVVTCSAGSGSGTLQSDYNNDADGSDAIITLTTADDSIIIRNPAASGTDSAYTFFIDQLNTTGAVSALDITTASNNSDAVNLTANSVDGETVLDIAANGLTTGKGISLASTATGFSSGNLLSLSKTGASGSTAFTGDIANVTYSQTFNGGIGLDSTGNVWDVSRAITLDNLGNTHTVSGALATISDTGTQTAGTLTWTGDTMRIAQNFTGANAAALNITTASTDAGTSNFSLRVNDDGTFTDSTPFVVDESGQVGIGTTAPGALLHIDKSQDVATSAFIMNANAGTSARSFLAVGQLPTGSNYGLMEHFGTGFTTDGVRVADRTTLLGFDTGGLAVGTYLDYPVIFAQNNAEVMRISDAGNVGIGDTGPDAKLEVLGTTEQLRLTYTDDTVDSRFTVDSSGNLTIDNTGTKTIIADDLQINGGDILDSNGNEYLRFTTTASAVNELTITNAATAGTVTLAATGGDTNIPFSIDAKGSGALNLNNTATGDVLLAGGSGSTGCTVTNSNGNLNCSGSVTGTTISSDDITISSTTPSLFLTDTTTAEDDYSVNADASSFTIRNETDSRNDLTISGSGALTINGAAVGEGTSVLTLTSGDLTLTDGDLTLTSGELSLTSDDTTTDAATIIANSLTTGTALVLSSTATSFNGELLTLSKTGASGSTAFTSDIANLTYSQTFNAGVGLDSTGNVLDISRAVTLNNLGNTHTVSGALATISDSGTQTAGTLAWTGDTMRIAQNYTGANASALNITTASTDAGTSNFALRVNDDGTFTDSTPFVVDEAGNVGIGDTSPTEAPLTIAGSADGTDALYITAGDILVNNGDLDLSGGDFNVVLDAGDGVNISKGAAPTVDVFTINGSTSSTDGVDGLQITFGVSAASGNVIDITPSYADATAGATSETYNIIDIDAFTATQNATGDTGTINGVSIGALTQTETAGTITATALNIGSGWDTGIDAGTNSILNIGDAGTDISSTGATFGVNVTLSSDASEGLAGGGLTDCDTASTSKLLWDTTTNKFSCGTDQNSGGTATLQNVYDNDTDGSDAIIALTTADDSIIVRNPAASGTDSAYTFFIDQLNTTGAVSALDITTVSNGSDAVNLTANSVDGEIVLDIAANGLTTGKGISLASTANGYTTGNLISTSLTQSAATGTSVSGDIENIAFSPTYSSAVTTPTISGNVLDISRTATTNSLFASTLTVSGALVTISDSSTQTTGTLTHTANVLSLTQNYASSSGTTLAVTHAGTGDLASLTASGSGTTANGLIIVQSGAGTITDAIDVSDETVTNGLNLGANNITGTTYTITGTAAAIDFTEFDVSSSTGAITIDDTGDAGSINIEATNLDINDLTFVGAGTLATGSAANLTINSGTTGTIAIGDDASAETINISTGGAVKTLAIGSTNTSSATTIQSGTGNITLNPASTGDTAFTLDTDGSVVTFTDTANLANNSVSLTASALTSGNLLDLANSSVTTTSSDLIQADHTATYTATTTVSGNLLDLSRSLTASGVITLTVNSPVATITDNCATLSGGTCTHTGTVLTLTQSFSSASGNVLSISNAGTGNAIEIAGAGTRAINSTSGNITLKTTTSGNIVLDSAGNTIDIDDTTIDVATQATDIELKDNTASALTISESTNNYLAITTTNTSENISFGNATTNPSFSFLGTGAVTIAGSADGSDALILTKGDILISDGDFDLSGGDFNVTLDAGDGASISKGGIPTVDILSLSNSSQGVTSTTGVDALSITYVQSTNATAITGSAIDISVTQSGDASDTIRGITINNITAGSSTETAISIGTGWDTDLAFADTSPTITIGNTGTLSVTDGTNTLFSIADDTSEGDVTVTGDLAVNGATSADITSSTTTATILNTTVTTLSLGGAATTLNLGTTDSTTRTINLGTGSGADTINIGTGATTADAITLGNTGVATIIDINSGAATVNALDIATDSLTTGTGLALASTATGLSSGRLLFLNKTGASGSTAFTGDIANVTYSQTFNAGVGLDSTGNVLDVSRAITLNNVGNTHTVSGALATISDSGTQTAGTLTWTGDTVRIAQNYTGANAAALNITTASTDAGTSNFALRVNDDGTFTDSTPFVVDEAGNVGIRTTTPGQELDVSGDITLSGNVIGDTTDSLRLQAGGTTTGSAGTASIYFLDSSGNTRGRFDAQNPFGDGTDGAITITASTNCQTTDISADDGDTTADCIATGITAAVSAGATSITVTSTTGIVAGDEILIIQMTGTGAGNYETRIVSTINSSTQLTVSTKVDKAYQSTGAQVTRIPQYTNVTINSGGTLTVSAWNGTIGGVLFIRASGTFTNNSGGIVDLNTLGGRGGAAGATASGASSNTCPAGPNKQDGSDGTTGNAGAAGEGAGGGSAGNGAGAGVKGITTATTRVSGGGGGGSGGAGAGGAHNAASSTATAGAAGGAGGTAGADAGGAGGSAGTAGAAVSAVGDSSFTALHMGGGGGGGGSGGGGASGACYNGDTGTQTATGGSGGNGGAGAAGGIGGGIAVIAASTVTNSGTIRTNGGVGSNASNGTNGGTGSITGGTSVLAAGGGGGGSGAGGGGGAGGSVWLLANTMTAGTVTVTGGSGGTGSSNTGGNGGACAANATDGGGGGGARSGTGGSTSCSSGGSNGGSSSNNGSSGASGRTRSETLAYGVLYAGSIDTTHADLAEYYVAGDKSIEAGDVVAISDTRVVNENEEQVTNKGVLRKASKPYDSKLIGIISTNPGVLMGSIDGDTGKADTRALALSGRVPVKIDPESSPIAVGDFLTSSSRPGLAMKATKAGYTVGKALESWQPASAQGSGEASRIEAFVNLGYYDPDLALTDTGNLNIAVTSTPEESSSATDATPGVIFKQAEKTVYKVVKTTSEGAETVIDRIGTFANLVVANIKAGAIESKEIVSNKAVINDLIADKLTAKIISPVPDSDLVVDLKNSSPDASESAYGKFVIKGQEGKEVASIDSQGDATFSGELRANTIYADQIVSKNGYFGEIASASSSAVTRDEIEDLLRNVETNQKLLENIANKNSSENQDLENIVDVDQLSSVNIFVTGQAAINSLSVSNSFSVGSDLVINSMVNGQGLMVNSIDTLTSPLRIQSLALAPIEIMAGFIKIDTKGNLEIAGNLSVAGTINTSAIQLLNLQGEEVASIDASGSAKFNQVETNKLIIANNQQPTTNNQQLGTSEIETNATAGKATIPAQVSEITIRNKEITDYSLVYVTPLSSTKNKVLYVKSKESPTSSGQAGKFIVGFTDPIDIPVEFNWWIIELHSSENNPN